MLVRRELPRDHPQVHRVHAAAFRRSDSPDRTPDEVTLLQRLRTDPGWIPRLSLVAVEGDTVFGHVVCTRGILGPAESPVLGLGPIGVLPDHQRRGTGKALMHAVLGAADSMDEPIVVLLGSPDYYRRFGFEPASSHGVRPPVAEWAEHFQVRPLTCHDPTLRGAFRYARPFEEL